MRTFIALIVIGNLFICQAQGAEPLLEEEAQERTLKIFDQLQLPKIKIEEPPTHNPPSWGLLLDRTYKVRVGAEIEPMAKSQDETRAYLTGLDMQLKQKWLEIKRYKVVDRDRYLQRKAWSGVVKGAGIGFLAAGPVAVIILALNKNSLRFRTIGSRFRFLGACWGVGSLSGIALGSWLGRKFAEKSLGPYLYEKADRPVEEITPLHGASF